MTSFTRLDEDTLLLQQRIERFHAVRERILRQVREVIVGQQEVLDQILIALFVGGHCLMTGMPGTAKTLHPTHDGRLACAVCLLHGSLTTGRRPLPGLARGGTPR